MNLGSYGMGGRSEVKGGPCDITLSLEVWP